MNLVNDNYIMTILFLVLTLIGGCKTGKDLDQTQIFGKYQWNGVYGIASNITLNKDNTFVYHWQEGLIEGKTLGTWHLQENNILILNSERQEEKRKAYEISYFQKSNIGQYKIEIKDENENLLPFAACALIRDSIIISGTESNESGICKLDITSEANTLEISYIGYSTIKLPISELKANEFSFTMFKSDDYYKYFKNKEWKFNNGRIIDPNIKIDKYTKSNYYEKVY